MYRCYIDPSRWAERPLRPEEDDAHHLAHVLRVRVGDTLTVFDGQGRHALARVESLARGGAAMELAPVEGTEARLPARRPMILLQAILKGNRMDLLIEKAVELGVSLLVPVMTERVVVRLDAGQAEERRRRWRRIALAAARQCGTDWLPEVGPVSTLAAALGQSGDALRLVGSLADGARPLRAVLEERRAAGGDGGVALVIGPEGDFTEAEHAACVHAGAVPVTFGTRVLRAETASLFALSAVAYALD